MYWPVYLNCDILRNDHFSLQRLDEKTDSRLVAVPVNMKQQLEDGQFSLA